MGCATCMVCSIAMKLACFDGCVALQEAICKVLDDCCLTDSELEAGPGAWEEWPCPWDTLFT